MKNYHGIIARQHHTDSETHRIAEPRAVRRVKEGADSTESYCYLRNILDFLSDGKKGMPFGGPSNTVWSSGRMSPYFLRKTILDSNQFWSKSLARFLHRLCIVRGRNLERRQLRSSDIEELEEIDASEPPRPEAQCKGSVNADEKMTIFILPGRRWNSQNPWREIDVWGPIHFKQGSSLNPLQDDLTRDDAEAQNDFWSVTGYFIFRLHVEPRVNLYMPKDESFSYSTELNRRCQNHSYVIRWFCSKNILMITGT